MHKKTLTLYELNQLVRESLAITMPDDYWVEAEISELREVRGHCYMELVQKDEYGNTPIAKASAKCWKNKWMYLRSHFERTTEQMLHIGLKIRVRVYADFHEAYGFSWIINDIDPTFTLGDMARRKLDIIRQLKAEGVFDLQKELSLPLFTQRIAVISSKQAAGYGDFRKQLIANELRLSFNVTLFQAVMQGEQVETSIIEALNHINKKIDEFDAVVIIRGGGATSDLSGFDSLLLAENVANFPLPIITGIGHDRDESILDMISCISVKTPTAAATLLVDHLTEVYRRIMDAQEEITHIVRRRMEMEKMRLGIIKKKVPILFSLVKSKQEQVFSQMEIRLKHNAKELLQKKHRQTKRFYENVTALAKHAMHQEQHRMELLEQRVKAQDPALLLKRGYSITLHNGKAVHNAKELKRGDVLETRVEKGSVRSVVE